MAVSAYGAKYAKIPKKKTKKKTEGFFRAAADCSGILSYPGAVRAENRFIKWRVRSTAAKALLKKEVKLTKLILFYS